jgi:hypothetical protein
MKGGSDETCVKQKQKQALFSDANHIQLQLTEQMIHQTYERVYCLDRELNDEDGK